MSYKYLTILFGVLFLFPVVSSGEETEYVDLHSSSSKLYLTYLVNEDYTVEKTAEYKTKALTKNGAKGLRQTTFSHSTSMEKFEVIEAYTEKADGSHIAVPDNNYQVTVNMGKSGSEAIFSDRTNVTVVFPEFEEGDTSYIKVKTTEIKPMFPGYFSFTHYFWSQNAHDDVQVKIIIPETMKYNSEVRKMQESVITEDGKKVLLLSYSNKKPVKVKRSDFSVWDETGEAGFVFSSFNSYREIAEAYGKRALPKAQPTKRIEKLAAEIVKDETDRKEKARLLYDWVATKISYAGNSIGVGAVVPHDTDFVLDNRMGDCKDHATLLEALYNVVGIDSTQVLINAGSGYNLPRVPHIWALNHVINYIPEWDKFIDPTSRIYPFNSLSFSMYDKPVLLVENYKKDMRTPSLQFGTNHQEIDSTMTVGHDGSISGKITVAAQGRPAVYLRDAWRYTTEKQEEEWLKDMFSSHGALGEATMEKEDPAPLSSSYSYTINFKRPDFIMKKGTGGFYIGPLVSTPMDVMYFMNYANEEEYGYDIACGNGSSTERLEYVFPDDMKILAQPENFSVEENYLSYQATYTLEGNVLKVLRKIEDRTPANVCSMELINRQRTTLIKVVETLQHQVIYQH